MFKLLHYGPLTPWPIYHFHSTILRHCKMTMVNIILSLSIPNLIQAFIELCCSFQTTPIEKNEGFFVVIFCIEKS